MAAPPRQRFPTWQLFAIAVVVWSTTWHAILYQLAHTPPEVGVALRFALAGALALGVAVWRGERIRLTAGEGGRVALQGLFMYSLAYLCVYHAERHVPSGLVAVGYSVSPLLNGVAAWALWRQPIDARFVVGGLLCVVGIGFVFWPEFAAVRPSGATGLGVAFTVGAVLTSAVGSLLASRNPRHRLPFWAAIGWGMLSSAVVSAAVGAAVHARAGTSIVDGLAGAAGAATWWLSLVYLAAAGSVLAFACYLTLQQRVGPGAASTVGVMTPVLALVISAAFEGYEPVALTAVGAALAVIGNVLILRPRLGARSAVETGRR